MRSLLALCLAVGISFSAFAAEGRNVVIFIADGLRPGSVNATDAPTMLAMRRNGVHFANSHSLFPTFTTPNASAIATGHYLGDTGDFSNTIYVGYPVFNTGNFGKTAGTPQPFIENDQILADVCDHYHGNYLNEETLLQIARKHGYNTAAVGKLGPTAIQDVSDVRPSGKGFATPTTVIIDDSTGSPQGPPLPPAIIAALQATGLDIKPPERVQPAGTNTTPGTRQPNVPQQKWMVDAVTRAILPSFKATGKPFALVFWSRDPDGSQHNHGDSLNSLVPGINGPTSRAGIKNADNNLKQILDYIQSDPGLAASTDVFLTSDHGFATISRSQIDAAGAVSKSYSTGFTYKADSGVVEVNPGFLPPGFLAIDVAHALGLSLHDPDSLTDDGKGYLPVDPTAAQSTKTMRQRPASGNGLLGASGRILDQTDAKVLVAANGGSDLIYVPDNDAARVNSIVAFLVKQDYVGGLFVDDRFGTLPGALPMSAVNLKGSTPLPAPSIVVAFKTFALNAADPLQSAIQIADTSLQQGQGMHGSFGRDNTFNNMAAIGPDFKAGFVDDAPVSNADIVPTLARVLGFPLPSKGALRGRVLVESLKDGPETVRFRSKTMRSPAVDGRTTLLFYQQAGRQLYFDRACFTLPAAKSAKASCP